MVAAYAIILKTSSIYNILYALPYVVRLLQNIYSCLIRGRVLETRGRYTQFTVTLGSALVTSGVLTTGCAFLCDVFQAS